MSPGHRAGGGSFPAPRTSLCPDHLWGRPWDCVPRPICVPPAVPLLTESPSLGTGDQVRVRTAPLSSAPPITLLLLGGPQRPSLQDTLALLPRGLQHEGHERPRGWPRGPDSQPHCPGRGRPGGKVRSPHHGQAHAPQRKSSHGPRTARHSSPRATPQGPLSSRSCWMAWEPSLGAFYGPAAFITLVTCVYFLGTYIQLRRHPERRYELRLQTEEQRRLAGPEAGHHPGARPGPLPACDGLAASLLQNEHSLKAQLRAAAFTLFLFTATWAFGALAVSQGHFLDMVFSCLYGAFCVTLGLFVLIHHCAKRDDVWHCWWSCCPRRGDAHATQLAAHPALDTNGDAMGHVACLQDSPCPGKPRGFSHPPTSHCKMTNLQAAQSRVNCLSPAPPCCGKTHCEQRVEDTAHVHVHEEDAFGHLHRGLQARTKPPYFSRHRTSLEEPEYAYHIPASLDGSPRSSRTDSPPSSLEGPLGAHTLACCTQGDPFSLVSRPEGSDSSPVLYGCPLRPGRESASGPVHFEMLRRTQSLPFGGPGQNGLLKGDLCEVLSFSANGIGNIRTGPWRNETAV